MQNLQLNPGMTQRDRRDVVILGGGPAGLAAAIALRQSGRSVLVVERAANSNGSVGEHLPPYGCMLLRKLGVFDQVVSGPHLKCYGTRSQWGEADVQHEDYMLSPYSGWGLNLARPTFEDQLAKMLFRLGGRIVRGAQANQCQFNGNHWSIELRQPSTWSSIQANYIIDATGPGAWFARQQGASRVGNDRMVACYRFAHVKENEVDPTVLVEATADGWWYSARLPENKVITMFFTDRETVMHHVGSVEALFDQQMHAASLTRERSTDCCWTTVKSRAVESAYATQVCGERWIAIGDAAITFDPISSLGISKSLEHGMYAAKWIVQGAEEATFSSLVKDEFQEYAANRFHHYERAGLDSPFWRRRLTAERRCAAQGAKIEDRRTTPTRELVM